MQRKKCQTRYLKEKESFGTMNECGSGGILKDLNYFKKTSTILPKYMICQTFFLKMTARH